MTLPDLEAMDRDALAGVWQTTFGAPVPAKMSQPMQRRFLAQEVQLRQHGDLAPAIALKLDRSADVAVRSVTPRLKPGARLLRAWNGTTHVVDVLPEGFLWNGRPHRSLSAIARAITGARWFGPRFFGLVRPAGAAGDNRSTKSKPRTTGTPRRDRAA